MDALIFSWSGSFRDEFAEREDEIRHIIDLVHDNYDMEAGIVSNESRDTAEDAIPDIDLDFTVGNVDNILDVLRSLAQKYDAVFFVTDIRAELVAVNQSGAYTIGYNSSTISADELSGVGPNYIVDSLAELEQILVLEHMG